MAGDALLASLNAARYLNNVLSDMFFKKLKDLSFP